MAKRLFFIGLILCLAAGRMSGSGATQGLACVAHTPALPALSSVQTDVQVAADATAHLPRLPFHTPLAEKEGVDDDNENEGTTAPSLYPDVLTVTARVHSTGGSRNFLAVPIFVLLHSWKHDPAM